MHAGCKCSTPGLASALGEIVSCIWVSPDGSVDARQNVEVPQRAIPTFLSEMEHSLEALDAETATTRPVLWN